jgi:DNA modification methylase
MVKMQGLNESSHRTIKLDQSGLNLAARSRTSRLPWRGQFSPELIEYLMERVCPDVESFYDPFCGSGTVLFEAIGRGRPAWGVEVNPAAWHLASLSSFASITKSEKAHVLAEIRRIAISAKSSDTLFEIEPPSPLAILSDPSAHIFLRLAVAALVILGMGNEKHLTSSSIARGCFAVMSLLHDLASNVETTHCYLADARITPLSDASIGAVITSPPYINVFNYHQNYRPAVELLGWLPLEAARSEIGSNRKHRQNRFLTVIQFALDMTDSLRETARVMQPDAPLIIILGRTSNVLGASFQNGTIIKEVIENLGSFGQIQQAERRFTNRYGDTIFEDILITRRSSTAPERSNEVHQIGVNALSKARNLVPVKNKYALDEAIEMAMEVVASPLLNFSAPLAFQDISNSRNAESYGSRSNRRAR